MLYRNLFDTTRLEAVPPGVGMTIAAAATVEERALLEPELQPRDEAIFWLTAAAEIEHALMVQYLFAAYTVRIEQNEVLAAVQRNVLQIAREEMGHLVSVQNLLSLLGAPYNFGREHSPFASYIYPFRFKLEALTLDSLAKYVQAERPLEIPGSLSDEDVELLEHIEVQARVQNDGRPVRHVGIIFARLIELFESELSDDDFRPEGTAHQARRRDWGYQKPDDTQGEDVLVLSVEDDAPPTMRAQAVKALRDIAEQGEGYDDDDNSHFQRFFSAYKKVREQAEQGVTAALPVVTSPNTTIKPSRPSSMHHLIEAMIEQHDSKGRITHPRTRQWAQLLNTRYRLLLNYLHHTFLLDEELYTSDGDRTLRGLLHYWTFEEMRRVSKIAKKLVHMPKDEEGELNAGPPFELPYSLSLPRRDGDRWRTHGDVLRSGIKLLIEILEHEQDADDEFLNFIKSADENRVLVTEMIVREGRVPDVELKDDFVKVVSFLEEGVRGFTIGRHGNKLWAGKTRDEFVAQGFLGLVSGDPDGSELVKRLIGQREGRNQMPRFRPPLPSERIQYIRDWIERSLPDSEPAGQVGVVHEPQPKAEPTVGGTEATGDTTDSGGSTVPSFEADIKPLFRDYDRDSMKFYCDLHKYEDVRDKADPILERLQKGDMPCDGAWPTSRQQLFERWIASGKNP